MRRCLDCGEALKTARAVRCLRHSIEHARRTAGPRRLRQPNSDAVRAEASRLPGVLDDFVEAHS